jgi:hypothetical protein
MDLARACWITTVTAFLITVIVLLLQNYYGYAGVTFVVGAAAALNIR